MDKEAWRAAVYGIAKSRTLLSNWTELNQEEAAEISIKNMFQLRSVQFSSVP